MKLTRVERWIISHQYRILEKLYPDEAEHLAVDREAIERGYEAHYDEAAQEVFDVPHVMTEEDCQEVLDILSMFRAIKFSMETMEDKSGILDWAAKFRGFDGNNEGKQLAYTEYYCLKIGRFDELHLADFNSHSPELEVYRRMLAAWEQLPSERRYSANLTREEIAEITSQAVHPDQR